MRNRQFLLAAVVLSVAGSGRGIADQVRYYEQDGVTYRETRQVVKRPVTETRMEQTTRTVYRQEQSCELQQTTRTWFSPVTQWCYEPYLAGRWNPLVQPYFAYRYVPRTRWEQQTEVVEMPVTCCRTVPETRTVQVPVTRRRMVTEEVIRRVALGGGNSVALEPVPRASRPAAAGQQIGGLARLDGQDPPRHGISTAWRPSTTK